MYEIKKYEKYEKSVDIERQNMLQLTMLTEKYADVAELVDALVLGTSTNGVGVRVPSSAPTTYLFELYRTDRYKYHSKKDGIFLLLKSN